MGEYTSLAIDSMDQLYLTFSGTVDSTDGLVALCTKICLFMVLYIGIHQKMDTIQRLSYVEITLSAWWKYWWWGFRFWWANDYIEVYDADFSGLNEITVAARIKWDGHLDGSSVIMGHNQAWYFGIRDNLKQTSLQFYLKIMVVVDISLIQPS